MSRESNPERYFQSRDCGIENFNTGIDDDLEFDIIRNYFSVVSLKYIEIRVNKMNFVYIQVMKLFK
jgi:hypothetical protein